MLDGLTTVVKNVELCNRGRIRSIAGRYWIAFFRLDCLPKAQVIVGIVLVVEKVGFRRAGTCFSRGSHGLYAFPSSPYYDT